MQVTAKDSKGNVFTKDVTVHEWEGRAIINFGGFCKYYASDLMKRYPYDRPLCIDAMGLNHRGVSGVDVAATDMNRILEELGFVQPKP